jgi:hypothetical protein
MDWLEQELHNALQRREPPAGFAARVVRRTRRDSYRWLTAAAAAVILVSGAGFGYRQHQGAVAKEQVMLAFKIAAVKVNRIQAHVQEVVR